MTDRHPTLAPRAKPAKTLVRAVLLAAAASLLGLGAPAVPDATAAPVITRLSPDAAGVGEQFEIIGSNFGATQGSSLVHINKLYAPTTSWSDTSITVTVPWWVTSGDVVVTVGGEKSNGVAFTIVPKPVITQLSPDSGAVGTSVTIYGNLFGTGGSVTFNGTAATTTNWSDTLITAIVPAGATTGDVVVTVGELVSKGVAFTVTAPTTPIITQLNPRSGEVGTSVTIYGHKFGTSGSVTFNGTAAATTNWSDTSIRATVPVGATTGNVVVTVNGVASNGVNFTVTGSSAPSITGLSPGSGTVGTAVTITGTNFGTSGSVTFNGTAASTTNWRDTSITATVPAGAETGDVVVTVNGVASNGVAFTVIRKPVITRLDPPSGEVGTSVTITGTDFGTGGSVTFNGTAASTTNWSDTSITATVPAGATTGDVVVTVNGVASDGVSFTVTTPTGPSITSLDPTSGPVGTSVTIHGTNFGTSGSVTFNGTAASTTNWSDTSITAEVPAGAATGNVVVTVGGVASNGVSFTVTSGTAPSITNLDPTSGPVGTSVTIHGTNFGTSGSVTFNGTAASTTNWSDTSITTTVPDGATTGDVVVTVNGVASDGVSFTVTTSPAPKIESVNPPWVNAGALIRDRKFERPGSPVKISGWNFGTSRGPNSRVMVNGTPVTTYLTWSKNVIQVNIPRDVSSGAVVVTVDGVASNEVPITVIDPDSPVLRGGSNYGWFHYDETARIYERDNRTNTARFECYGVIKNYHRTFGGVSVRAKVNEDLSVMKAKGQKRLRIPIRHGFEALDVSGCSFNGISFSDGGFVLSNDASGSPGHSSYDRGGTQQIQNMKTFLADVVREGFTEVIVAFFPHDGNDPLNWGDTWYDSYYQQNRNYIFKVRNEVLDQVQGLNYTIELLNEGAPESSNTQANPRARYVRTLWRDYNSCLTNTTLWDLGCRWPPYSKTIGFSAFSASRLGNLIAIYDSLQLENIFRPDIFSLHPYDGAGSTAKARFEAMRNELTAKNVPDAVGVVVGEALYNDPITAEQLHGQRGRIRFLTQWPKEAAYKGYVGIANPHVTVVPLDYCNYIADLEGGTCPPFIDGLSPASGPVGTVVTISGSNFGSSGSVTFNGTPATTSHWSATSITTTVPARATTGDVVVTVGGVASDGVRFEVTDVTAPTITPPLSPASGPVGTVVTISGSNFGSSGSVTFNGTPATTSHWSATSITTTVPEGTTTGNVVVTVGGVASNGVRFEVRSVPGPTCDTFTTTPALIDLDGSSTLRWTTSNATSVSIDQGIGSVAVDGNRSVSPSSRTTYTLTAARSGSDPATCTVTVKVRPRIDSFSADRTTINRGQPVTLRWTTTNATSASIDQGVGSVAVDGSRSASPTRTTTYTLTASNGDASVSKTVKVTVNPTPPGTITASPNPCTIEQGDDDCTTTLSWSATGTTGLRVEVSRDGAAARLVSSSGRTGSTSPSWIRAGSSYTFSLYDYMDRVKGALLDSVTVTGRTATVPDPTCDTFTATPALIDLDGSSTLRWTTSNATSVNIDQGIDSVAVDGNRSVSPSSRTTYTLTAARSGSDPATCTVTVKVRPRIDSFSADRTTINRGQPVTLRWTTTNATSASIDQGVGSVAVDGSRSASPTRTTTYTLTASNGDASVSRTVKVTVNPTPTGTITASPNPCQIQPGESKCTTTLSWSATGTTGLRVEVSRDGAAARLVSSSGRTGSTSPSWIRAGSSYTFSLYDYMDRVKGALLDSVAVTGNPPPQIDTFTASPSSITRGASSTLSWTTTNASSVTLSGHPSVSSADGSQVVVPWTTTTYTLTAIRGSARVSQKKKVTVSLPPAPVIHNLTPSQGVPDSQTTISGSNFSTTQGSVTFGGISAEINSWTATSVSVQVPARLYRGQVSVSLTALGQTSNSVNFTVTGDSPYQHYPEECDEDEEDCRKEEEPPPSP